MIPLQELGKLKKSLFFENKMTSINHFTLKLILTAQTVQTVPTVSNENLKKKKKNQFSYSMEFVAELMSWEMSKRHWWYLIKVGDDVQPSVGICLLQPNQMPKDNVYMRTIIVLVVVMEQNGYWKTNCSPTLHWSTQQTTNDTNLQINGK